MAEQWEARAQGRSLEDSVRNTDRGAGCDWNRPLALLDEVIAADTLYQIQSYTTLADDPARMEQAGRPSTITESSELGSEPLSTSLRD